MRSVIGILLLAISTTVFAAETKTATMPSWCQPGWACIPMKELVADTGYKIDLEERLAVAEIRLKARHRFGIHVTCGMGVAATATQDFDVKLAPAGYCGIGYGW